MVIWVLMLLLTLVCLFFAWPKESQAQTMPVLIAAPNGEVLLQCESPLRCNTPMRGVCTCIRPERIYIDGFE